MGKESTSPQESSCAGVRCQGALCRVSSELGLIWTQHPPVLKLTLSLVNNGTVIAFLHCIPSFRPEADSANAAKPSLYCSWAPEAGDGLNKAHTPPSLCSISKSLAPVFSLVCPFSTRSGVGRGGGGGFPEWESESLPSVLHCIVKLYRTQFSKCGTHTN